MAVVPFAAKNAIAAPLVEGVVARSEIDRKNTETAWVSVVTASKSHVLVIEFKAADYGKEAWARAVKYGKGFADRLGVTFKKKRGAARARAQ